VVTVPHHIIKIARELPVVDFRLPVSFKGSIRKGYRLELVRTHPVHLDFIGDSEIITRIELIQDVVSGKYDRYIAGAGPGKKHRLVPAGKKTAGDHLTAFIQFSSLGYGAIPGVDQVKQVQGVVIILRINGQWSIMQVGDCKGFPVPVIGTQAIKRPMDQSYLRILFKGKFPQLFQVQIIYKRLLVTDEKDFISYKTRPVQHHPKSIR